MFGNMTQDLNKHIIEIKYNHLNLPIKITFVNGNFITYLYDAMGVKVNKYVQGTSGSTSTASSTDYLSGFQYNNQNLQFFPHAEGYVHVLNGGSDISSFMFDYVYQYKDHLGNIRVSFVADKSNYTNNSDQSIPLKITTENHYYPFGLQHTYNFSKYEPILELENGITTKKILQVPNSGYQYKFNNREWQDELGLNTTAMDFRQYDNALGRFYAIDKVAELQPDWNPYRFAFNNPVFWKDPSGLSETNNNIQTIELDEVVIKAKKRNNIHDTGPPALMSYQYMPKKYNAIGLDDFNKKYNTNFKSFDDWYYRTKYLPVKMDMIRSMHSAQETAGKYVAMLVGGVALAPYLMAAATYEALGSGVVTLASNPLVQKGLFNMSLNAGSQYIANGGNAGDINLIEAGLSAVPGTNLIPTIAGETFSLTANKFDEGVTLPNSFSQWGIQVGGGILSNRFGKATDNHMTGEGFGGAFVSEYFKLIIETGSNAAPSLVD
jgi:RHS repeat-associated protein